MDSTADRIHAFGTATGDGAVPPPGVGDALLVVDVQNDFLPGGALAVPQGDAVIAPLNGWIARFTAAGLPVFASRDWHPGGHCSFHAQGGPWPPHCVAGSAGAAFAEGLALPPDADVVSKGVDAATEAYSAFADTGLAQLLRVQQVERLFVGGLATDYCVLHTVADALRLGFEVVLLPDAMRAVDVHPGDGAAALQAMHAHGAALWPQAA
jgi:nicotinamidase/pyrazinamidase